MQITTGTHIAPINSLSQCFHVFGSGPVLFAHPGGPGLDWEYLRMPEVEEHFTVVYVEPIGTGESGRLVDPSGYTYDRYVLQLVGLADHLGIEKISLIGHSSGGFVAQRFALDHPGRLAALVLYDTSAVVDAEYYGDVSAAVAAFPAQHPGHEADVSDAMAAWAAQGEVTTDEGFSSIARRVFPLYFHDFWAQEAHFRAVQERVRGWLAPQRAGRPVDVRRDLPGIRQPTLIVVGRSDFICGPRWSEQMHEALPHSTLHIIEGSGHFGHIETPAEFSREVIAFLTANH